jgi:hypothetical protein
MNSSNSKSTPAKSPQKKNFEDYYNMDSKIGKIILIFFILTTVFWIVLYTFNPSIVQGPESSRKYAIKGTPVDLFASGATVTNQNFTVLPDSTRCFVGALLLALICVTLLWLFRSCY